MKRSAFDESSDLADAIPHKAIKAKRLDYRCAADGCPNAGAVDDRGDDHPGRCFWHWQASRRDWASITMQILHSPSMGNHGAVPTLPSRSVQAAAGEQVGRPHGLRSATTGAAL